MDTFVVGTNYKHLTEVHLTRTHNIYFCGEIRKMFALYSSYLKLCSMKLQWSKLKSITLTGQETGILSLFTASLPIKVLRALVGQLSLSAGWENGPEQGLNTVSFYP